jgi:predicted transcriptional regulator
MERIKAGLTAAREGRVRPADAVFADIAARHGFRESSNLRSEA